MGMPLELETMLLTEGKEKRIDGKENRFQVILTGYRLFPIDQNIDIKRNQTTEEIGTAKIVELTFKNQMTFCTYQLISLSSVN